LLQAGLSPYDLIKTGHVVVIVVRLPFPTSNRKNHPELCRRIT